MHDLPFNWHEYVAAVFAGTAVVAAIAPGMFFGTDGMLADVARCLPIEQQMRFQNVVTAGFVGGKGVQLLGYGSAVVLLLVAAICMVPSIPPAVPTAIGVFFLGLATAVTCARLPGGARRIAGLARRTVPWPIVATLLLAFGATLGLTAYPPVRLGSAFVAAAILCLSIVVIRLSLAPERLRGEDPALELAVADLMRRTQVRNVTSVAISLALLNYSFSSWSSIHADSVVASAMIVPVFVASVIFGFSYRKDRAIPPILAALAANPA